MKSLSVLDWIAIILVVVGAINWGLVGIHNFNLVSYLFGAFSIVTRIIYVVVAIAGIYLIAVTPLLIKK